MRTVSCGLAFLLLAGWTAFSPAGGQPDKEQPKEAPKVSAEEIDRLVKQLGDDAFVKRSQARSRLEAIGEPALGALRKAAEKAEDLEIRNVAKVIADALETKRDLLHILRGHNNRVNGVAISADGKRALSASWDGTLRYWNVEVGKGESGTAIRTMKGHKGAIMGAAISPDGKRALSSGGAGDHTMRLWDLDTGAELRSFEGHTQTVWDVAFSPDGKKALSGSSDGKSRLWDVETGKELLVLDTIAKGMAWTVAFADDGKQAVTGGGNHLVKNDGLEAPLRLWDLTTGKEIRQFVGHTKDIRNVAVSPDSKRLLSGSFDGTMRLWDMQTGKELRRFEGPGHFVESVRFLPDGKHAICSYGPQVAEKIYEEDPRCALRLWDLESGKELRQFKGHDGPVLSLSISRDGRTLVSGSADNSVRVWRIPNK